MNSCIRTPKRMAAAAVLALALGACGGSSSLVNMWKDPKFPKQPLRTALVIAIKEDPAIRRIWEDAFVSELAEEGVSAIPSYRGFPTALPDTQQVIDLVKQDDYDGVITVVGLGSETQQTYIPGYVTTAPVTYYNHWTGYYDTRYREIYEPGYVTTDQVVRQRVDVWSVDEGGTLVWTGTTQTINPTSGDEVRKDVTDLVIPELKEHHVITSRS